MKLRFLFFSILALGILSCDPSSQNDELLQSAAEAASPPPENLGVPESVSFVEIEIPEAYIGDCQDFSFEILPVNLETEEGSLEGQVRVAVCSQGELKLVSLEVSYAGL